MISLARGHVVLRREGVSLTPFACVWLQWTWLIAWAYTSAIVCRIVIEQGRVFDGAGLLVEHVRWTIYLLFANRLAAELARRFPLPHVVRGPGSELLRVARFVFPAKYVMRVFEPIVADHCEEWVDAEARGAAWHSRWIRVRCVICIVQAMGLQSVVASAKSFIELWRL